MYFQNDLLVYVQSNVVGSQPFLIERGQFRNHWCVIQCVVCCTQTVPIDLLRRKLQSSRDGETH